MNRAFSTIRLGAFALSAIVLLLGGIAQAAPIPVGDLVVMRVGDGTTTPTGTALPVTLDHYSVTYTAGVPTAVTIQQSIALPSAAIAPSTGNRNLTAGGTAAGEGGLYLSSNGQYMTLAGYNSAPGGVTNPGSTGTEDRVIGRLELLTGNIDTTTAFQNFAGSTNGAAAARGAYTTNGTDMYLGLSVGVRYGTFGVNNATTGIAIDGTNNVRRNSVYKGQLYQTEGANARFGVEKVGTGLPTTVGSATMTLLPGFPTSTNSPYDFWFADDNTIYVADDRTGGNGGLEKWTFNGSTWSMAFNHSIVANANSGIKGLTGWTDGLGNVTLFVTTQGTSANKMYGLTDTLSNTNGALVTENLLVDASTAFSGTAWNLRGVAINIVPEPASIGMLGIAAAGMLARRSRKA